MKANTRGPNVTKLLTPPPRTPNKLLSNGRFNATISSEEEENTAIQQPKIKELITKINKSLEFIIGNQAFKNILNKQKLIGASENFKKIISNINTKTPIQIKDFFEIINYTSKSLNIEKERPIIEDIKMKLSSLLVLNLL